MNLMRSTLRAGLLVSLALSLAPIVCSPAMAKDKEGRAGSWKSGAQGAPDLNACKKRVQEHPDDAEAQNDLGWAWRQNGDLKSAESCLRESIKLNPNLGYSHSNLSVVLLDGGQKAEALTEAQKAVALDAKQAIYQAVLGNALSANGDAKGAINAYKAALAIRPDYENAMYNLGRVLDQDGQQNEAKAVLSQALALDPGDDRVVKLLDQLMK
ncbi:MAG: tetratricopeptide repeat protein [Cyanobacteria bacterium SZAS LIN-5]|nr:tetratricopeptide repeat protein [Cyanobacteria bacterium SZAS LIN-5]RTL39902.1 MAG: tetratricopeptide repeat protein [Candidatus Melainabacteria bacterium]